MKTVLAHGVFDVLHLGHIKHLEKAKTYGDRLIVSITPDAHVNKGPGRPQFTAEQRAAVIRSLRFVDEVHINDSPTATSLIHRIRPDFYVKGTDYKDATQDVTGQIINEKAAVEAYGGKLVFTDEETFSSSSIINKSLAGWSEAQRATISQVCALGGYEACSRAINVLEKLSVLVIGEPIIDIYRFVRPEGISSKSPTVSARFEREERYEGGAWAIAAHLNDFCKVHRPPTNNSCKKIRYISGIQRIFEVTEIDEMGWSPELLNGWIAHASDVLIAADFGHGLFDGLDLSTCKGFIGLNVQTNSSNFGFNVYTKHKRWDYLCIDKRELQLAHNDRFSDPMVLGQSVWDKYTRPLSVTLGSNGSALWSRYGLQKSPAFTDSVVDATGAGDAYFAITTLLMATDCHPELVTFIGNVFAGLKTKIIGNKSAVSKASLLKALKAILA